LDLFHGGRKQKQHAEVAERRSYGLISPADYKNPLFLFGWRQLKSQLFGQCWQIAIEGAKSPHAGTRVTANR
jgi:hypothetical protein